MDLNFTVVDVLSSIAAVAIFPIFIVVPGYVLGWILNLISFREQPLSRRLLLSLPFSVALTPVIIYLLERYVSLVAVWAFYVLAGAAFVLLLAKSKLSKSLQNIARESRPRVTTVFVVISLLWIGVAVSLLVDLQIGRKLYLSVVSFDYSIRSAAVSQFARIGQLPPSNPFFFPGHAAPFRYHYFWFLLCSLPDRLAHGLIGPRHAVIAGVVWIGFALAATIALYLQLLDRGEARLVRSRTVVALSLLCVSGLDIVPNLINVLSHLLFHRGEILASVDWWNPEEITGWLDSALWVPHHLAGLLACIAGFMILWKEWQDPSKRIPWQTVVAAGLAFSSACGLSIYVTFVFAAFLASWSVLLLVRGQSRNFALLAFAGMLSILLASPVLRDLAEAGSSGTTGHHASFLRLAVRTFRPAHMLLYAMHKEGTLVTGITDFFVIPLNLFAELGVFFVIAVIRIRKWIQLRSTFLPINLAEVVMLSVSLLICLFVRSNTIDNNDLGMRGMLIVQFVLLIWGAEVVFDWWSQERPSNDWLVRWAQAILIATLCLGAATNVYEYVILRCYTIFTDAGMQTQYNIVSPGDQFAARAFFIRQLYEWLAERIPSSAVEQHNPFVRADLLPGLYSNRQMGMAEPHTAIAFGGNPQEVEVMTKSLKLLFVDTSSGTDVDQLCRKWKINYLVARSMDPVWDDKQSWVWKRRPLVSNEMARGFGCGMSGKSTP